MNKWIPEVEQEDIDKIGIAEFQCFPTEGRKYKCIKLVKSGKKTFVEVYCYDTGETLNMDYPIRPIKFTFYPVWVKYPDGKEQILNQ